ncbi:recombinase family protein [Allofournierella sp.]|uniref:recombinase family protein n=1 Tax=Allofournierella sp. TaxID=1940256 RepID=UPI003AB4786E
MDEEAAQVVKRIFTLCMEGRGPSQIATLLTEERILIPAAYHQKEGRNTPSQAGEKPYKWHQTTVAKILERKEYTGCTVNFKTYTNSIWDKKKRESPAENQTVFYGTHPAIIKVDVFDKVQELRRQRHRHAKTGKTSLFSGLVYCADCNQRLYYCTTRYFEKRQDFFVCSTHRADKEKCSGHYIRAVVLEKMVWLHMAEVIFCVTHYETHFRAVMERELRLASEDAIKVCRKRLAQAEKRLAELDRLFIRLYEDNVSSKITDERFTMMSSTYEDEQKQLKVDVQELQQEIEVQERQIENLEQFIQRISKYTDLQELPPYALRELVKAIYVEAPDKSSGKRRQGIHICYDLIGFIPLDTLTKEETA